MTTQPQIFVGDSNHTQTQENTNLSEIKNTQNEMREQMQNILDQVISRETHYKLIETENGDLKEKIEGLKKEISDLQVNSVKEEREHSEIQNNLDLKNLEVEVLKRELNEKEEEAKTLKLSLDTEKEEAESLKSTLESRKVEFDSLKLKTAKLESDQLNGAVKISIDEKEFFVLTETLTKNSDRFQKLLDPQEKHNSVLALDRDPETFGLYLRCVRTDYTCLGEIKETKFPALKNEAEYWENELLISKLTTPTLEKPLEPGTETLGPTIDDVLGKNAQSWKPPNALDGPPLNIFRNRRRRF
jgi:hypothetical protein